MALAVPKLLAALPLSFLKPFNTHSGLEGGWRVTLKHQARRMTMLTGDVRPKTLRGIKSLAVQLRKERGIKYATALDLAAQTASYSNFRNAQRSLAPSVQDSGRSYVLLSIYWCNRDEKFAIGRETLRVELSRPILDICGKYALKKIRGFGNLRMVAEDHFVCDELAPSQAYARERLCTAERSIRFMEFTGLRPPRNHREAHSKVIARDKLPSMDHSTVWIDPVSNQFILVDEPYGGAPDQPKRASWAARTGWKVVKTESAGMYRPYDCDLYVATDTGTGYDLDALVASIDAIPHPLMAENWIGESSRSWETFVSPLAKTPQAVRHARCHGTILPMASAKSVPCFYNFGSSRRRPIGELSIAGHIAAGSIIKAVMASRHKPSGVWERLSRLRSTLEDWLELERRRGELEGPEFFQVYYGETIANKGDIETAKSQAGKLEMLRNLKQSLQKAYSDCAALRRQLHRIEMVASAFQK